MDVLHAELQQLQWTMLWTDLGQEQRLLADIDHKLSVAPLKLQLLKADRDNAKEAHMVLEQNIQTKASVKLLCAVQFVLGKTCSKLNAWVCFCLRTSLFGDSWYAAA